MVKSREDGYYLQMISIINRLRQIPLPIIGLIAILVLISVISIINPETQNENESSYQCDANNPISAMNIYSSGWNLALYLLNLSMLIVGMLSNIIIPMIIMGLAFFIWNTGYVLSDKTFKNRNYDHVLQAIRRCRDYMAWFIVFYSIIFGNLLTSDKSKYITDQFASAGLNPVLMIFPFFLITTGVLFVPAKMTCDSSSSDDEPSISLKFVFGSTAFLQQYSTFLLALFIGKIVFSISRGIS